MGSAFFANDMHLDTVLEHPGKYSATADQNIKKNFVEPHQGMRNAGEPLVLWDGMKLNRLPIPMKDAQFLEVRTFQTAEICRFFNMPLHKSRTWRRLHGEMSSRRTSHTSSIRCALNS